jgi:O-methyltransferase involved in polyketide biosynthesis
MTSLFRSCAPTKRLLSLRIRRRSCRYCSSSSEGINININSRYTATAYDVNVVAKSTTPIDEAREAFTNDSAFMIAYERAIETENMVETPLICDPFARLLTGRGGGGKEEEDNKNNNNNNNNDIENDNVDNNCKGKELSDLFGINASKQFNLWPDFHKQWTAVRTKFIDDHICKIINEHKLNQRKRKSKSKHNNTNDDDHNDNDNDSSIQFVNLGCGLDTRVLRLECMSEISTAYEVDMDVINTPKEALFNAILNSNSNESVGETGTGAADADADATYKFKCPRKVINANLTNDDNDGMIQNLISNGFDTQKPTIFLAEGLIMYLGNKSEQFLKDLNTITSSGGGGSNFWLILNFMDYPNIHHYDKANWTSMSRDRIRELLQEEGSWKELKFNMFGDEILNYGRYENQNYNPTKAFSMVVCRK